MGNELKILAQFIQNFRLTDVPEEILRASRFCVLDSIGSALGAASSPEVRAIGKTWLGWGGLGENGLHAAAWCQGYRTSLQNALTVNGIMSHDLELDDVHTGSKSHVGAVVVPTAWTIADAIGATGKEFLEAVIVGYEVMARVGLGMDVSSNRKRGWHATGILGTFGAAAAAARLLKLSEKETVNALGLAGSQSCGLWAFLAEGATCKKLNPARAVLNGVASCLLAQSTMTGPVHVLDAKDGGLYPATTDEFDTSRITDGLGQDYQILKIDKKPYPCCRTTHHAIDAALKLRAQYQLKPEDIASVLVETYDVGVLQCGFEKYPESPVEAKFSIQFTCAVAFVKGRVTRGEFCREMLEDPQVSRIARASKVVDSPLFTERYPKRWGSRMTLATTDGRTLICQIDDMSGSVAVPLTPQQEMDKFLGLVAPEMGQEQAEVLLNDILRIDDLAKLPDIS